MTSGAHDHPDYALADSTTLQFAMLRADLAVVEARLDALEGDVTVATRTPGRAT